MRIRPVILSGGAGTRLWPASRETLPKQFIDFPGVGNLFVQTLERAAVIPNTAPPLIVSNRRHAFLCRRAAEQFDLEPTYIL